AAVGGREPANFQAGGESDVPGRGSGDPNPPARRGARLLPSGQRQGPPAPRRWPVPARAQPGGAASQSIDAPGSRPARGGCEERHLETGGRAGDGERSHPATRPSFARLRVGPAQRVRLELVEELVVVGVARESLDQRFHRFDRLDREKHLSKLLHLLVFLGRKELLLFAGARLGDVDRRENALLGEQAIQGDLAVSRPLELLENYLIHAAAG